MFREKGNVVRKFVAQSGKFASLVLDVPNERGSSKLDFVSFDCVDDIKDMEVGSEVAVEGRIGMNKLTSKNKEPVMVDGFNKWVPQLVVTKILGVPAAKKARPKPAPVATAEDGSDDLPF